jgi:transposase
VEKIDCTLSAVVIRARCWPSQAACPACGTWSSRVHGSYVRQVRDLPLGGRPVLIHLAMRRFVCMNVACKKVTFAGQADGLTARYQRWSVPLAGLLSQVALELAGRAGTGWPGHWVSRCIAARCCGWSSTCPSRRYFCTGGAGRR